MIQDFVHPFSQLGIPGDCGFLLVDHAAFNACQARCQGHEAYDPAKGDQASNLSDRYSVEVDGVAWGIL